MRPVIPKGLDWVNYSHETTYGPIDISWSCRDGEFSITCDVPVGATATIWVPFGSEKPNVKSNEFIIPKGARDGYALYKVQSGRYSFNSKL